MDDLPEITCLEKILARITYLIGTYESGDIKELERLCNIATTVALKLDYIRNYIYNINDQADIDQKE